MLNTFPLLCNQPPFTRCKSYRITALYPLNYNSPLLPPCSMWDLSSLTRNLTCVPCTVRWILSHSTTREVPTASLLLWTGPSPSMEQMCQRDFPDWKRGPNAGLATTWVLVVPFVPYSPFLLLHPLILPPPHGFVATSSPRTAIICIFFIAFYCGAAWQWALGSS